MKQIKNSKLNELLKQYKPKKIIYMYLQDKIELSSRQINKLLYLKGND